MSKNDRTYQHEDVMQAVVSALLFGEKAGLAAYAEHGPTLVVERGDKADEKVVRIHPEGGSVVHITTAAARMLANAQVILFEGREDGLMSRSPNRIDHYVLAEPAPGDGDRPDFGELFGILSDAFGKGEKPEDEAVEIDMDGITPGNTEQVYHDQPIPKREA